MEKKNIVILPNRKIFKTPRLLVADAYTIGGNKLLSDRAREKSTYYVVFRRHLKEIDSNLYDEDDDRIVFVVYNEF